MPPLDRCHVIDMSMLLPGPLATQILRDLGARVTKVEPPFPGDYAAWIPPMVGPVSASYCAINRGKEVVSINLKDPAGLEEFEQLVQTADVVVEGFRPGVLAKLGLDYTRLSELNPGVILCSVSGFGQSGPYSQRAGHDLGYQAIAGVLSISGGDAPTNPPLQVADTAAGSYAAAMLVLAALLERTHTGRGRHIDVSMSEQLLPLMTASFAVAQVQGHEPKRDGELLSGGAACYRIYQTSDGHHVTIGAIEPKFWQVVVERLGAPELASAPFHGGPGSDAVTERLKTIFVAKTRSEWLKIFGDSQACFEPVLSIAEALDHPHWKARGSFQDMPAPNGQMLRVPKMPGSLAGFDTGQRDP